MDLVALKSEIQTDPLTLGYAQFLPDAPGHVVDLLNGYTQSKIKAIAAAQALTWAASGPMSAIVDASNNAAHPARASALAFLQAIGSAMAIDMDHADIRAQFDGWQAANVITQAQHDALIAVATQPASRAEVLGFGSVAESDLHAAGVI